MENFIFGVENIWINFRESFVFLLGHIAFWSFWAGFFVAYLLSFIVIAGGPSNFGSIVMNSPHEAYKKVIPTNPSHARFQSVESFKKLHTHAVTIFYGLMLVIVMGILYLLLSR